MRVELRSNGFFKDYGKERKLEIGRRLLRLVGYAPGFLNFGEVAAVLRDAGNVPVRRRRGGRGAGFNQ